MRYILFAGYKYYPSGGAKDLRGYGNSIDGLRDSADLKDHDFDWWHILDTEKKEVVASSYD